MNILILHMRYAPDATGTGPLVTQLAEDLVAAGEQVSVITSVPHYGRSQVSKEYRQGLLSSKLESGVSVWRTAAFPWWGGSILGRAIDYGLYTMLAFLAGLRVLKPDVILAVAPPITVGPLAWIISKLRGAPIAYNAQDIWPDGLVRMGRLRNLAAIRMFHWLEAWIYRMVDQILVVSEGMKQNLEEKGVSKGKIKVIPNWVDLDAIKPIPKDNSFCREHDLEDRFVVLFAGNLGYAAGLEVLLNAANYCQQHEEILFLLVGAGSAKKQLEEQAINRG
ncbi:MAG: glycosyltransferase family 4 protein, partial [Anaerolineales bacterium]